MELLERDSFVHRLDNLLKRALAGQGQVALVSGEAGIGKTSLVEYFTHEHEGSVRVLWGACDALFTPRPLGPLHDIANDVGGELPTLLKSNGERQAIFSACLAELKNHPTILVFEDIHWADVATLDLIKFLGLRWPDRTLFEEAHAQFAIRGRRVRLGNVELFGNAVSFTLKTNGDNLLRMQMCNFIKDDLAKVGIKCIPSGAEFNTLITNLREDFQYEAILLGLQSGIPPDPGMGQNVWRSSGLTHYWNIKQPKPETATEAKVDELTALQAKPSK